MHILITKRTPAAPWRYRTAGLTSLASPRSAGYLRYTAHRPNARVLIGNSVFGRFGRARTKIVHVRQGNEHQPPAATAHRCFVDPRGAFVSSFPGLWSAWFLFLLIKKKKHHGYAHCIFTAPRTHSPSASSSSLDANAPCSSSSPPPPLR